MQGNTMHQKTGLIASSTTQNGRIMGSLLVLKVHGIGLCSKNVFHLYKECEASHCARSPQSLHRYLKGLKHGITFGSEGA
jgi:hypothetical protein